MASQNDGRIPGGPTTPAIINERKSHISSLVFSGERYDYPEVKLREHGEWRTSWELTAGQKALVSAFEFDHLDAIRIKRHDRDLILSIIERWWPKRNTFQVPFGEITITLADVSQILGLPIEGYPVYFNEGMNASDIIRTYLGVEPPSDIGGRSTVRLTWLRSTFMHLDRIDDTIIVVDDLRVICCTRAYLLCLCGSFLFSDSTGNMINVRLLPFFENLDTFTRHAWGTAVLAYLYNSLTSFVSKISDGKTAKNVGGCLTLIQFWCYDHFAIGRPLSIYSEQRVFPGGLKWNTENIDYQHCVYKSVSIYQNQFDRLCPFDVNWQPQSVPEDIINNARGLSLHRYYIMYNGYIMFHPADRVMRQFGLKQMIPFEPLSSSCSKANIEARANTFLLGWYSRFTTHGVEHMSEMMTSIADVTGNNDFVRWYGYPLMQNRRYEFEEPRFEARAIDDRSLRELRGRVDLMADNLAEMSQIPGGDPTGMFRETSRYLRAPLGPSFVPLDISDDHPVGIVRQRHARPRTTGERGASSSKSPTHSPQDGAESSQPYGGSSQPYSDSSQPYTGTSQPYSGTSHPYAGTSQPYSGSSYPYAGTSQPYAGTSHPYAGTSDPYACRSHPYADTSQSYEGTSRSYEGASQSYEGTPQDATQYDFDWDYYIQMTGASLFGPSHLDQSSHLAMEIPCRHVSRQNTVLLRSSSSTFNKWYSNLTSY